LINQVVGKLGALGGPTRSDAVVVVDLRKESLQVDAERDRRAAGEARDERRFGTNADELRDAVVRARADPSAFDDAADVNSVTLRMLMDYLSTPEGVDRLIRSRHVLQLVQLARVSSLRQANRKRLVALKQFV